MSHNREKSKLLENTVESLRHGIGNMDGVELDLRLCRDNELVLHHDTKLMIDDPEKHGFQKWTENNTSDELKDIGFFKLDDLLSDKVFLNKWNDSAKLVCFEMKLPHPRSGLAGGWKRGKWAFNHVKEMCKKLSEKIDEIGYSTSSSIIFSFYPKISHAAKSVGSEIKTATLKPHVPQWGNSTIQKLVALPNFASSTLYSLSRNAQLRNSPIIACGLEYFKFPTNRVRFGRSVSLKGNGLVRLNKARKDFPIFVWPAPIDLEKSMLNAGITCISDNVGSDIVTYPSGEIRWQRPATQPINSEYQKIFGESEIEHHKSIIKEAEGDLPHWVELNESEKITQLELWKGNGYWSKAPKLMHDELNGNEIPWEIVRMIAHRGDGITGRPSGWWNQ